ncbi:MAG: uracil-DNA glycosylase [Candidatus Binatus sp.]|uniref:uracil-DNA glycosylase n=1 Tax=Candidatus Binatus sp. TaxID=2811406 RepID=UPI00271CB163|nr:uracil-DNA glycosylase [Candidatus Binatus sp.]MDO8432928.1 uracil-DNA glycosylase [Candidatus Binatus sp.]
MGSAESPLDRRTLVESLRDYVEQIREEGLEGLPASSTVAPGAIAKASAPPQTARTQAVEASKPDIAPGPAVELISKYPGLEKASTLDELREFIGDCTRCKLAPCRTNLVFGVGNPSAQLMFVGEAPGADEDARGEPFVGRAGQLLTDIIERGMGISRSDVYICNVIKCRPPDNRNPEPDEVASCEPFLMRQIDLVRPRAIVGLGTFAVHAILKIKTPISKLRGNWHELRGIRMMPTFHPAYLLRNPGDKRLVWADIQEVMKYLGMPIPRRGGSSS